MNTDSITFVVWVFFLPLWLVWEIFVLKNGEKTISQIARQRAWQFTAFVFFWSSMPVHWWVPIPWGGSTIGTVAFWTLQAAILGWNIATWKICRRALVYWEPWRRWVNWPVWYVIAGPVAAALLFPQAQRLPWQP